jgi:hypothetical protein
MDAKIGADAPAKQGLGDGYTVPRRNTKARGLPGIPGALAVLLWFAGIQGGPGQPLRMDTPIGFFTDTANRLLANAGYTFGVSNIQVWPVNLYTPSVHRILQVAANLCDATGGLGRQERFFPIVQPELASGGSPNLPSVFRPVFGHAGLQSSIYIVGYVEATDASMAGLGPAPVPVMRDLCSPRDRALLGENRNDMVYGLPVVIGARKGFPNFNEFAMETMIQLTREIEFRRPDATPLAPVNQTNQMFLLCISNVFGMEAWNSYQAAYPRGLQVTAAVDSFATLSNELGTVLMSNVMTRSSATYVSANTWTGYMAGGALKLPLDPATNNSIVLNGAYVQSTGQFTNAAAPFERGLGFPVPHFWLSLRTRARFILADTGVSPNRIIDYVNLDSTQSPLDITLKAGTNGLCEAVYIPDGGPGSLWCTNRLVNADASPTYGVLNQIGICLGSIQPGANAGRWNNAANGVIGTTADAINYFRGQLFNTALTQTNKFYAPYNATRTMFWETSWQANDPLVHYTVSDLTSPALATNCVQVDSRGLGSTMSNLGRINGRYQPWGTPPGETLSGSAQDTYNLTLKDPRITRSDDWDFPTAEALSPSWLGRVHRGTPWQTVYLKSALVDYVRWRPWTGNMLVVTNMGQISTNLVALYNANLQDVSEWSAMTYDALFTNPTNDWRLASLLAPLFNTDDPHTLFSVNQPSASAWATVLDGLSALTNVSPAECDAVVMSSNSVQAGIIASAINARRILWPGGQFRDIGDVLLTPELGVASPWLSQKTNLLTDAAYEALPAQLLSRLRPDSFGSVARSGEAARVGFTGADAYGYTVQVSSNLVDWMTISTNFPINGSFQLIEALPPGSPKDFYRTVLLPLP